MLVIQSHVCLPVNDVSLEIQFIQCIHPVPTSLGNCIAAFTLCSMDNHFGLYYEFVTVVVMYCMYCVSVVYNILFIIVVSVFLVPAACTAKPHMNFNDIWHVRLYCSKTVIV